MNPKGFGSSYHGFALTDTAGAYRIDGVPLGDYIVSFSNSQAGYLMEYWKHATLWEKATTLTVATGGVVSGIDGALVLGGSISGRLTAADTGAPIAGVSVSTSGPSNDSVGGLGYTDSDGRYTVRNVPPGANTLRFEAPYKSVYLGEWWNDATTIEDADTIMVTGGKTVTGRNASLSRAATISGTVRGTGGTPLVGVLVEAWGDESFSEARTTTDSNGKYTLGGLLPGTYALAFNNASSSEYTAQWWKGKATRETATPITVGLSQVVTGRDATLTNGASIAGRVTAATGGAPLAMVSVTAHQIDGSDRATAYTAADGSYLLTGLEAGDYVVRYDPASVAGTTSYAFQWSGGAPVRSQAAVTALAKGQVLAGVDVALLRGATITGAITDAATGKLATQINAYAWDADGTSVGYAYSSGKGTYTVKNLPAGSYRLSFFDTSGTFASQWWSGKTMLSNADPIVVTTGATLTGRNARMTAPGSVSGSVEDAAGAPLEAMYVTAWLLDSTGRSAIRNTATNRDGRYTLTGLPAGPVRIQFSDHYVGDPSPELPPNSPAVYSDVYWKGASTLETATPVTIVGGKTLTGISATMKPVPKPLTATPVPTVAGTAAVGHVLTAKAGTWAPVPVTLTYQWLRAGTAIPGATGKTYTLTTADAGTIVTVAVTGSKDGYTSVTTTSVAGSKVLRVLTATPVPTIAGTAKAGSVLTAQPGAWAPAPVALTYQWLRDGVAIEGATKSTYTVAATDTATKLSVIVRGTKSGYVTMSKTSAALTVLRSFTTAPAPTIAGTPKLGATLTAKLGSWAPTPDSFSYVWKRDGKAISGATAKTYTSTSSDLGARLTVTVTAKKAGYVPTSTVSSSVTIPR